MWGVAVGSCPTLRAEREAEPSGGGGRRVLLTRTRHQAAADPADSCVVPATKLAYGVVDVSAADERSDEASTVFALLFLVVGLAAATIWLVALPLFDKPHRAAESCEMFVLTKAGVTKCVPESAPGTPAGLTED